MAFLFRLETMDGAPAEPPTFTSLVSNWSSGDVIPLSASRRLQVLDIRDDDAERPPVLVVEGMTDEKYVRRQGA
jgi:hypothetical protein